MISKTLVHKDKLESGGYFYISGPAFRFYLHTAMSDQPPVRLWERGQSQQILQMKH